MSGGNEGITQQTFEYNTTLITKQYTSQCAPLSNIRNNFNSLYPPNASPHNQKIQKKMKKHTNKRTEREWQSISNILKSHKAKHCESGITVCAINKYSKQYEPQLSAKRISKKKRNKQCT